MHLSDDVGGFEHARSGDPRVEGRYCTDDVGRALVVACREPEPSVELDQLALTCAGFLVPASRPDGRFRGRMSSARVWQDDGDWGDASGGALWGLGEAYAQGSPGARQVVRPVLAAALRFRSSWPRATAYPVLGAAAGALGGP